MAAATIHHDEISSPEIAARDDERFEEIDARHQRVARFLADSRLDAVLLRDPVNFAWFTAGADCSRAGSREATASLFVTPDARVVVTHNADSVRLFERELPGLGFQLKERPWYQPRHELLEDLCRGRKVAGDTGFNGIRDNAAELAALRLPLAEFEVARVAQLGRRLAHAVEATCRHLEHGQSESDIAGQLAHRMIHHGIVPARIQVAGDGRLERFRQWTWSDNGPVDRFCTISAVGCYRGLHAGVARTVSFGEPPDHVRECHQHVALLQATAMYFSQDGWELAETFKRVARIYEKFGHAQEWQKSPQAEVVGYDPCEVPVTPDGEFKLQPGMPVFWHPAVGPAMGGDTIMVAGEAGFEFLTPPEKWPTINVEVKGRSVDVPGIWVLKRKAAVAVPAVESPPDDLDATVVEAAPSGLEKTVVGEMPLLDLDASGGDLSDTQHWEGDDSPQVAPAQKTEMLELAGEDELADDASSSDVTALEAETIDANLKKEKKRQKSQQEIDEETALDFLLDDAGPGDSILL